MPRRTSPSRKLVARVEPAGDEPVGVFGVSVGATDGVVAAGAANLADAMTAPIVAV